MKKGREFLHIAAFYGQLNLCKTLIKKHKLDAHVSDKNGWTAFHYSAKSGRYELNQFFTEN